MSGWRKKVKIETAEKDGISRAGADQNWASGSGFRELQAGSEAVFTRHEAPFSLTKW
jgi:hypothetical protein